MANYRETLTFQTIGGRRGFILQCNKSDAVSQVFKLTARANKAAVVGAVTMWHPKKGDEKSKPKNIHFVLAQEGVYEITNQTKLAGYYLFVLKSANWMIYHPISPEEKDGLLAAPGGANLEEELRKLR
ncbi:hypothetical protein LU699_13115 [Luteimonas fraxinea]|nr:hypothetical protein [Luteimonas fraxinea]UHH09229.1 hypothetical protein LU699_13115 [Luteimonas fraxinea]